MEIKKLKIILDELKELHNDSSNITRYFSNKRNTLDEQIELITEGREHLRWIKQKHQLSYYKQRPTCYRKDIFYCDFGKNVGIETNKKRPALIISNDTANKNSPTVQVAIIKSYNHSLKCYKKKNGLIDEDWIDFINEMGLQESRKLKFYEVPIELEPKSPSNIIGIINISQIQTIDKKRLDGSYVGKITENNMIIVKKAIERNLIL